MEFSNLSKSISIPDSLTGKDKNVWNKLQNSPSRIEFFTTISSLFVNFQTKTFSLTTSTHLHIYNLGPFLSVSSSSLSQSPSLSQSLSRSLSLSLSRSRSEKNNTNAKRGFELGNSIIGRNTNQPIRSYSRFPDPILSHCFSTKKRLFVIGDAVGVIRVCQVDSRAILRTMTGHNGPVTAVAILDNFIFSGGLDGLFIIWDLSTGDCLMKIKGHQDKITSLVTCQNHFLISSSLDHSIKIWDLSVLCAGKASSAPQGHFENQLDEIEPLLSLGHDSPVTNIALLSPHVLVTVGGPELKYWSIPSGTLIKTLAYHSKPINCMQAVEDPAGIQSVIVTGGQDRLVKVIDSTNFKQIASYKFDEAVTGVGAMMESGRVVLIVALQSGRVIVKNGSSAAIEPKSGTRMESKEEQLGRGVVVVAGTRAGDRKKKSLQTKLLKAFRYGDALTLLLKSSIAPSTLQLYTLLTHLLDVSGALYQAVHTCSIEVRQALVEECGRNVADPVYGWCFVQVLDFCLDWGVGGGIEEWRKVSDWCRRGVRGGMGSCEILGILEGLGVRG